MLLPLLPGISTDRHLGDKQFFGCLCGSALCPVRTVTETGGGAKWGEICEALVLGE